MNKLFIILILAMAIFCQPWQSNAAEENSERATAINLDHTTALIVDKTNAFRRDHQLQALPSDANLTQAAQQFADFMARTNKYGHHADGRTPAERVKAAGYDYCAIRENIAYHRDSRPITAEDLARFFTQGWIGSPGHRENILAKYATETGTGVATTDGLTFYAVQLFGRPKSASYEITLTNNTDSVQTLNIEAEDRSQSIDLSPLTTLKMERCFPVTLTIENSSITASIEDSAALEITRSDAGELGLTRK
jgi:uncharacterized protein YkwD